MTLACFEAMEGCSNKEDVTSNQKEKASAPDEKLHIFTTFYPMYEFTKNIRYCLYKWY